MHVRDAVEEDAEALAAIAGAPEDVMRGLVHDRTVRVAEREGTDTGPNADVETDERELLGFVSYDARDRTVHITQFGGTREACERLLAEPIRFAQNERMRVEVLVPADEQIHRDAVESVGFEQVGTGPQFEGSRTIRYRIEEP